MKIEDCNRLFDDGTLSLLFREGFINVTIFNFRGIYLYVDMLMKVKGYNKEKAVHDAEIKFNLSRRTIYLALKRFK